MTRIKPSVCGGGGGDGIALVAAKSAGYSLLELSLVLVILGLLMSGGMQLLTVQHALQMRQKTDLQLEEAKDALISYAMIHGRLPRPAISATDGDESKTACSSDQLCTGILPWEILGLIKGDSWGKMLRYSVSPQYAGGKNGGNDLIAIDAAGLGEGGATEAKVILTINPTQAGQLVRLAHAVPAVIYSQGAKNLGTSVEGKTLGNNGSANIDEVANQTGSANGATPGTQFVARPTSDERHARGEFDDQLIWLSPHVLKARLVSAGRLP